MKAVKADNPPESRNDYEVTSAEHRSTANGPLATGTAIATMADGERRGVTFRIQGRHYDALRDRLRRGRRFTAHARWHARDTVTITRAAHIQPA